MGVQWVRGGYTVGTPWVHRGFTVDTPCLARECNRSSIHPPCEIALENERVIARSEMFSALQSSILLSPSNVRCFLFTKKSNMALT